MRRALIALGALLATSARAEDNSEGVDISARAVAGDEIAVEVVGWSQPLVDAVLTIGDITEKAKSIETYAQVGEPIALVFVVSGAEHFMGLAPDIEKGEADGLERVAMGFDLAQFGNGLPKGSLGGVVVYDTGARLLVPLGPIEKLEGNVLGKKQDYFGKIGSDLEKGILLGLEQLEAANVPRKGMIVIGDGNDTNNDAFRANVHAIGQRAAKSGIALYALIYRGAVSESSSVIQMLTGRFMSPTGIGLSSAIAGQVEALRSRRYLRFSAAKFPHDGQLHHYTLVLGDTWMQANTIVLPKPPPPPTPPASRAWLFGVGLGLAMVAALAIGTVAILRRRRR
jgi:hypothetical protein